MTPPRSTPRPQAQARTVAAALTEADVQRTVTDALALYGWRYVHFRPGMMASGRWVTAMTGHRGWPDLFAARAERAVALEVKGARGVVTPDQQRWLDVLNAAGIEAWIVTPDNLDATLERLR